MRISSRVAEAPLLVLLLATFHLTCASGSGEPRSAGLTIRGDALLKVGPDGPSSWILPNGRRISPLGTMIPIDRMPFGIALTPDGRTFFLSSSGSGRQSVTAVDATLGTVLSSLERRVLFLGLAVSPDGRTVYASGGGSNRIEVLSWDGASLNPRASFEVTGYPGGLALSSDGSTLYVACQLSHRLAVLDAATGEVLAAVPAGGNPFAAVTSPTRAEVYVSSEMDSTVSVFDVRDPRRPVRVAVIPVQKNPEGMAATTDGTRLIVASSDEDSVSTIDVKTRKVVQILDLRPLGANGHGTGPNSLAFSPDGRRLFIAQAADNKVSVVDLAEGRLVGAVPTAWYPTAVAVSADGGRLFVGNSKGTGSGPSDQARAALDNNSTLQILDIPGDDDLASLARKIDEQNTRSAHLFDIDPARFRNPVPLERGGGTPFKHVLIAIRENKTYDALLGDWSRADGKRENCLYCGEETPNLHALVERFASGDNYYSNAEASIQGHELLTAAISNVYVEKNWPARDRPDSFDLEVFFNPSTYPKNQYLFQNLLSHQIPFRVYGEAVGLGPDLLILNHQYVHWGPKDPPWFWTLTRDVDKLDERIAEWERDGLPPVAFMLFPNDHTLGCEFPFPTPRSMIADNDFATGRLVEWLSRSRYWKESVLLVVEDDPQDGVDHVDAHRSILLVVSPYSQRGHVSHVHYHEGNLHATIEQILGLPPLSVFDENAQPMWDLFSPSPDLEPFYALPREVPEEISMPGTTCAERSAGLNFLDPDEAEGLQGILWDDAKEELSPIEKAWLSGWYEVRDRVWELDPRHGEADPGP